MTDPQTVYTRDLSSGKVHRRTLVDGKYQSFEPDNLDEAGEFEVIDTLDTVEVPDLCLRCFGDPAPDTPGDEPLTA